MWNTLTEFELAWLLELAMNGSADVPDAITERFRELGYAELTCEDTRVTYKGRMKLMDGLNIEPPPTAKDRFRAQLH